MGHERWAGRHLAGHAKQGEPNAQRKLQAILVIRRGRGVWPELVVQHYQPTAFAAPASFPEEVMRRGHMDDLMRWCGRRFRFLFSFFFWFFFSFFFLSGKNKERKKEQAARPDKLGRWHEVL